MIARKEKKIGFHEIQQKADHEKAEKSKAEAEAARKSKI